MFTFIEMNQEHCMKYFLCLLFLCCTQYAHAQGKLRSDLKGNVQAVVKNMEMMGTRGDTIRMKTTLKYDENKNLIEETVFFADATAVNHKVIYNYNSRGLMTNKTRYMQATNMDNGIIADIHIRVRRYGQDRKRENYQQQAKRFNSVLVQCKYIG